jgi:hypothetical protein
MPNEPSEADTLRALEEALMRPDVRNSADRVGRLLADDFIEFGSSGRVFGKAEVVEALRQEGPDPGFRVEVTDFAARQLAPGVVLATYRTSSSGPNAPQSRRLRSSIWKLIEGRWQMLFHQGTPASD